MALNPVFDEAEAAVKPPRRCVVADHEQLEQLEAAVQAEVVGEVRRIAHSCAGASATCGMRRLVPLLRELERQGAEEKLTNAAKICQEVNREFDSVRKVLEAHLSKNAELAAKV